MIDGNIERQTDIQIDNSSQMDEENDRQMIDNDR